MMDEQAIRKWAWDEVSNYRITRTGDVEAVTELRDHRDRIARAEDLAAWAMSGKKPE